MSSTDRTVLVRLKAETNQYTTSLNKASKETGKLAQEQKKVASPPKPKDPYKEINRSLQSYERELQKVSKSQDKVKQSSDQMTKSQDRWKNMGTAAMLAGAAIAAGLYKATQAAAKEERAMLSMNAVFGESAERMEAYAEKASALGISITDYAKVTTALGAKLKNLGFEQDDLADSTNTLVQMGADISAQFGVDTPTAINALSAAMAGATKGVKKYGVILNDDKIAAEMAATGFDKAHATLSLLQKQLTKSGTLGAWARNADTAAESTAIMNAEFENAEAAIGKALLPFLTKSTKGVSGIINRFNELPDPLKTISTYVMGIGAAALLVVPRLGQVVSTIKAAIASLKVMSVASKAAFGVLGVAAAAIGVWATSAANAEAKASELKDTLDAATGAATELTRQKVGEEFLKNFSSEELAKTPFTLQEIISAATEGGQAMDDLKLRVMNYANETGRWNIAEGLHRQALLNSVHAADRDMQATRDLASATKESSEAAADATDSAEGLSTAQQKAAEFTEELKSAFEKTSKAAQEFSSLMDALFTRQGVGVAMEDWGEQLKGIRKDLKGGMSWTEIQKYSDSWQKVSQAMIENGSSAKQVMKRYDAMRGQIRGALQEAGIEGSDAEQILDRIFGKRREIQDTVTVSIDGDTSGIAAAWNSWVGSLNLDPGMFNPFQKASGGYIQGPGSGTSDSIPAMLSNGEYVMKASAVRRIGVSRLDAMNYAGGGAVQSPTIKKRWTPDRVKSQVQEFSSRSLETWLDRVRDIRDAISSLRSDSMSFRESIKDNVLGSLNLMSSFDFSGYESAQRDRAEADERVAKASQDLYDAQVALNEASPDARAQATKNLAEAERGLADARKEQAQSQRDLAKAAPTSSNIIKSLQEQAKVAEEYTKRMLSLKGKGLSKSLIDELAGADPEQAMDMLRALDTMKTGELQTIKQIQVAKEKSAQTLANVFSEPIDAAIKKEQGNLSSVLGQRPAGSQEILANKALEGSEKRLAKARSKNGVVLTGTTKSARANQAALGLEADIILTIAKRTYDRVKATQGEAAAQRAANQVVKDHSKQLITSATAAGFSKEAVKGYLSQLGMLPKNVSVNYESPGIDSALVSVADLSDLIGTIPAKKDTEFTTSGKEKVGSDAKEAYENIKTNFPNRHDCELHADDKAVPSEAARAMKSIEDNFSGPPTAAKRTAQLTAIADGVLDRAQSAMGLITGNFSGGAVADKRQANMTAIGVGIGERAGSALDLITGNFSGGAVADKRQANMTAIGVGIGERAGSALGLIVDNYSTDKVNSGPRNKRTASLFAKASQGLDQQAKGAMGIVNNNFKNKTITVGIRLVKAAGGIAAGTISQICKQFPVLCRAGGGLIQGPGTATSDSIPVMLSTGEYVLRAAAVKRIGVENLDRMNQGDMTGPVVGGIGGGSITPAVVHVSSEIKLVGGVPVILTLDSREILRGQLDLRRRSGDTYQLGFS